MLQSIEPSLKQQAILKCIWLYLRGQGKALAYSEMQHNRGRRSSRVDNIQTRLNDMSARLNNKSDQIHGQSLTDEAMNLLDMFRNTVQESTNLIRLPISGEITAGMPVCLEFKTVESYDLSDTIVIDAFLLPTSLEEICALRVRGEFMKDALICDGDIVILQKVDEIKEGDMVIAYLTDEREITVKQYYREGEKIRLQPANPDDEPITTRCDNVEIQGKVILVHRQISDFYS